MNAPNISIARSELLIIDVDGDGQYIRVYEHTPEAEAALREFCKLDAAYIADQGEHVDLSEYMDAKGIRSYTTEQADLSDYAPDNDGKDGE